MAKCDYLVAIGASAGGLDPCERFFNEAPVDKNFAYVVIQHLSPDFRSLMDELLARHSSMPIHRVEDGMEVEANTIYLNRPRQILTVTNGRFSISPDEGDDVLRLPIDSFFESLARDFKERAVGVVLSGSGSDGARGAREIKLAGGRIFVQSPNSAKFESMPNAVISNDTADGTGLPEDLPQLMLNQIEGREPTSLKQKRQPTDDPHADILNLLQDRFGTNFQNYKPETIKRRLERRRDLADYATLSDYFLALVDDQSELEAVYSDLLIEVTAFFRDEEAFHAIEHDVIPAICANMSKDTQVRMWVPGCASGEEAYSLAMLVAEYARINEKPFNLKILATDVHQRSLSAASAGTYSLEALAKVSDARREEYFEKIGEYYQVRPTLRRAVVFSPHDLMSDPPFTRMDLVSCRNVMIYLTEEAQRKLLTLFHFSLRKHGVLFLGPSETTGKLAHEFTSISQRWRIFEKKREVRIFDSSKVLTSPRTMQNAAQLYSPSIRSDRDSPARGEHASAINEALQDLLRKYAPAGFLLTQDGQLAHIFGEGKQYLTFSSGSFRNSLEDLIEPAFKPHLSPMLERFRHGVIAENVRAIRIEHEGETRDFRLSLRKLHDAAGSPSGYGIFSIEDVSAGKMRAVTTAAAPTSTDDDLINSFSGRITELEQALKTNEEALQSTLEEMETSNEELQATNEELMSANEELQSTNEELHSVNEELYTVSAEHQRKIEELTEITSDMDHLLKSTEIGTIFLDADFHVRRFTPAASKTFNLIAQDIGRPFAHVTARFQGIDIFALATQVQDTFEPVDSEIYADGRAYLMRILPYAAQPDHAAGVVITTIDIDDLKRAQSKIINIRQFHSEVLQDVAQLIFRWGKKDGKITYCNAAFADFVGRDRSKIAGKSVSHLLKGASWKNAQKSFNGIAPGAFSPLRFDHVDADGRVLHLDGLVRAIGPEGTEVTSYQFSGRDRTAELDYNTALEHVLDVDRIISDVTDARDQPHPELEDARMNELIKIVKGYLGATSALLTIGVAGEEDHPLVLDEITQRTAVPEGTYETLKSLLPEQNDEAGDVRSFTLKSKGKTPDQALLRNMNGGRAVVGSIVSKNVAIGSAAFIVGADRHRSQNFTPFELSLVRVVIRLIGYIWERRRRIQQLERTSDELQLIFDSVSAKIWYKDDKNKILRLNKAAAESMSITVEEGTGADTYALFPDMAEKYHEDDLKVIRSGKPLFNILERYTPKEGKHGWASTDKIPYLEPESGQPKLLVVANDVTDLKDREDELNALNKTLERERARHQALYLNTPAMMFSTDSSGRIENVNTSLIATGGYARAEMIGKPLNAFFTPLAQEVLDRFGKDHPDMKDALDRQYLFQSKSGATLEVELSGIDHQPDDTATQKLWVVQDVSMRNTALKSMTKQNAELAKLNDGLAQFAYAASHDLQEPLRKISQYGDLLQEEHREELGQDGQYFVDVMTSSAQRMSGLIKNLLEFSSAAQGALDQTPVDLRPLVDKAVEEYKDLINQTGAQIEIGALPKVICDPDMVQIVMTNVIGNALKYRAPKRSPVLKIESTVNTEPAKHHLITFQDNGLGFDDGDADRIFEPFARLIPKSKVPGSGIGLAICRTICERHGWSLSAVGSKGKYASFTIKIPERSA
ncbi:MAG: CheR family methyltransferase [Pseudomonadota bacterium]